MGKMLLVVLCFIVCDFVSGIAAAIYRKEFKSSCMREGLVHKSIEISIVLLSIAVQWALPIVGIEINTPIYPVASVYIVIMELSSICENIGKMNPTMAGLVSKLFGGYINSEHDSKGD